MGSPTTPTLLRNAQILKKCSKQFGHARNPPPPFQAMPRFKLFFMCVLPYTVKQENMVRSQFPWGNSDLFGIDLVCGHYIIGELDSLVEALVKCLGHLTNHGR